jgi:hypothetical protein
MKSIIKVLFTIALLLACAGHMQGDELKRHPGWAIIATAVIPGGGQFYAENYARGFFFGTLQMALLSMTAYEKVQEMDYKRLYDENGEKETWDQYNKHKSRVRNLMWWDVGIWFFACADAFADAHFFEFEEERFSFDVKPVNEKVTVGISIYF